MPEPLPGAAAPFPNAGLVGRADARARLLTPALLLEWEPLEANLARMQAHADHAGVALRPHAKAHKCPELARLQLRHGAVGVCVATPGEAAVFAAAGCSDILLTSTIGTRQAFERVADLATWIRTLTVVFDHPACVEGLAQALARRQASVRALVDLDLGGHRSGVADPRAARDLAEKIARYPCFELVGVQAYAHHLSHCRVKAERERQMQVVGAKIHQTLAALGPLLPPRPVVTGASTGAFLQELALGVYTELQCGSYVFMDAEYDLVDADGSGTPMFGTSLFVLTAVISANHPGQATTDAGEKRFVSKLGTRPVIVRGAQAGASYLPSSDEHGTVTLPAGGRLAVGDLLEVQVPHCDPTVNLYDCIHVMRGDALQAIWPIAARGA
ncbi:alanine racemase [Castellaniella sp. GW247-6E4]|uniref:alanine racemase n=1 Tax=Castellaniella sp. GW247-6E4 TaxID=3140380 RepID=UPI003315FB3B